MQLSDIALSSASVKVHVASVFVAAAYEFSTVAQLKENGLQQMFESHEKRLTLQTKSNPAPGVPPPPSFLLHRTGPIVNGVKTEEDVAKVVDRLLGE